MTYRANFPGGAFVSSQPIAGNDYIRADRSYTPPAGYRAAGPQPHSADTFVRYVLRRRRRPLPRRLRELPERPRRGEEGLRLSAPPAGRAG